MQSILISRNMCNRARLTVLISFHRRHLLICIIGVVVWDTHVPARFVNTRDASHPEHNISKPSLIKCAPLSQIPSPLQNFPRDMFHCHRGNIIAVHINIANYLSRRVSSTGRRTTFFPLFKTRKIVGLVICIKWKNSFSVFK